MAQLRALPSTVGRLNLGESTVDLELREVRRGDAVHTLTPIEAEALTYLAERAGTVVTQAALQRDVWGYADGVESKTVAVCMRRLRAKLEVVPRQPQYLKTIRGVGWCLRLDGAGPEPVDSLPRYRTRWVGRDRLGVIIEALRQHRTVTLWGPAGVGKTRAAVEVARHLEGVTERLFVALSDARDADEVVARVGQALEIPATGGLERVVDVLVSRPQSVIVLDEVEAHVAVVGELVERLAQTGEPSAWVIATSRAVLGVDAEHCLEVPPLRPDDGRQLFAALALRRDAAFDERSEQVNVDRIVQAVEANPLALELAAARLDLQDAADVARSLMTPDGGPVLDGLRTQIRRSVDALEPDIRAALAHLTVFVGCFDLDSAVAVIIAPDREGCLRMLLDAALVQGIGGPAGTVLSIQTAIRELMATETPAAARDRHAAWFADQAATHLAAADAEPESAHWLDAHVDDLMAALRHSLHGDRASLLLRAVYRRSGQRGPRWWRGRLDELLAADPPERLRETIDRYQATNSMRLGSLGLVGATLDRLAAAAESRGDDQDWTQVALLQARLERQLGHADEAAKWARDGLSRAIEPTSRAAAHNMLGVLARDHHRLDEANVEFDAALALYRGLGDRCRAAGVRSNQALLHSRTGNREAAMEGCREALTVLDAFDDAEGACTARMVLGALLLESGRHDEAGAVLSRGIAQARRTADRSNEAIGVLNMAFLDAETGRLQRARRRCRTAHELFERLGHRVGQWGTEFVGAALAWRAGAEAEAEVRLREDLHAAQSARQRAMASALLGGLLRSQGRDEGHALLAEGASHAAGAAIAEAFGHPSGPTDHSALPANLLRLVRTLAEG